MPDSSGGDCQRTENLHDILAVDGVDGVFIGPSDLAASMGHVGNPAHPDVVSAIKEALSTIKAAGKFAGLLCLDPAMVQQYIDRGACFVGVGVDTLVLAQGARQLLHDFKQTSQDQSTAPQAGY